MTRDDIIRMAREARWIGNVEGWTFTSYEELERFAALVAAHQREQDAQLVQEMVEKNYDLDDFANSVRAGAMRLCTDGRPKWLKVSMEVAAEREACAKVCEADGLLWGKKYAKAIRARGDK